MAGDPTYQMEAKGIRVAFDPGTGQLALFEVERQGRRIAPFARVPWADRPNDPGRFPPDMPPHLRAMSGDFFCAPFCADDRDGAPPHGWPANARWDHVETVATRDGTTARFRLTRQVAGAIVDKIWALRDNHPFLYQRHLFSGGHGAIPVAHHVMLDLRTGGLLRLSPKLWAETPDQPPEPGRSVLRYPSRSADLSTFPGINGPVDLLHYPIGRQHEDFVMLIDDPAVTHGWATVVRPAFGDVAILVKSATQLPQTMMWFSNGGRDHAPWCGEHVGVLGIEEACSFGPHGWNASIAPNTLTVQGIATAIDLGKAPVVGISVVIGALPTAALTGLHLGIEGSEVLLGDGSRAPFDAAWLARPHQNQQLLPPGPGSPCD